MTDNNEPWTGEATRCEEFVAAWFESAGRWVAIRDDSGERYEGGSIGEVVGKVLRDISAAEADFDCVNDTGEFYRYVRATAESFL